MSIYTDYNDRAWIPVSPDMWQPSSGDLFVNGFKGAWASNPQQGFRNLYRKTTGGFHSIADFASASLDPTYDASISLDQPSVADQQAMIDNAGLTGVIKPEEGVSRVHMQTMLELKAEEIARQNISSRAKGFVQHASEFAGGLAGSFVDPINVGAAYVPTIAFRSAVKTLGSFATTRALGSRLAGLGTAQTAALEGSAGLARAARLAVAGAREGALGAAIIEPIVWAGQSAVQADYALSDSLVNIAFGSVMGAVLHSATGMIGYARALAARRGTEGARIMDVTEIARRNFEERSFTALKASSPGLDETLARQYAQAGAALYDANARRWGAETGEHPSRYYERYPVEFRSEQAPMQGQGGERASISWSEDSKAIISFLQNPDASSVPHELFHLFRREMAETAASPTASEAIRTRYAQIEEFVGAQPGKKWTTAQEEKFARAGEAWLMGGKAPSPALDGVLEHFKGWMGDIYGNAQASGMEISPQMRNVFSDMFTVPFTEAERHFTYAIGDVVTREPEVALAEQSRKNIPDTDVVRMAKETEAGEIWQDIQLADANFEEQRAKFPVETEKAIAEIEEQIAESDAILARYNTIDNITADVIAASKRGEPPSSLAFDNVSPNDVSVLYESAAEKRLAGADDEAILASIMAETDRDRIQELGRNRALKLQRNRNAENLGYVLNTFRGKEGEGISALLVGSKYARKSSHMSVDALGTALSGHWRGELVTELAALSQAHLEAFKNDTLNRDIVKALFSINNPGAASYTGPKMAKEIADVIVRMQEKARYAENRAGAWIPRIPGYVARQTHDAYRIHKGGMSAWVSLMADSLDWAKTAGGAFEHYLPGRESFLRDMYASMATGKHTKTNDMADVLAPAMKRKSTAWKASAERVFFFRSAEAWLEYSEKYGTGSLSETVVRSLDRSARNTALMRIMGPSPQTGLERLVYEATEALKKAGDIKGVQKLSTNRFARQMKELDGTLNIEGNPSLAAIGRNIRSWQNVTKLGGAVISALSDIPNVAGALAYRGAGGWCENLMNGVKGLLRGRGKAEQQRILASLGVYFDSTIQGIAARFSHGGLDRTSVNNTLNGVQNLFFKWSGLSWWTDTQKATAGLVLSHDLARQKSKHWTKLSNKTRRALSLYGIDEGKWEIIRSGETRAADGRHYLTPDAVETAPQRLLSEYLEKQGKETSSASIAALREEITDQFRTYFSDGVGDAVIESSAKTRSILRQGTSAGTLPGEVLRFFTQFKSFGVEHMNRFVAREIYGYGAESFTEGLWNAFRPSNWFNNDSGHVFRTIALMTLFAYAAMSVKQLAAGKTPRSPHDPRTWIAALAQGGAFGLYGDFLFSELAQPRNRFGGSPLVSLLGPTAGSLETLSNLYLDLANGEPKAATIFRAIWQHVPGNNLFYTKAAFDYLIAYNLYEALSPGYIRRMKQRIEKEQQQTFWLDPATFTR